MIRSLLISLLLATSLHAADADLRLELVRESLTGTHHRYRQYINGLPVVGGSTTITRAVNGEVVTEHRQLAAIGEGGTGADLTPIDATHAVNFNGVARFARRTIVEAEPLRPIAYYVDVITGEILRIEPLYFTAKPARVFDPNPVTKLNDPTLRDQNDSATAVPASAYVDVELDNLASDRGPLSGPHVTIVDIESPAIAPIDVSRSLVLDRQDDGFEEVNAYYHVDRTQKYLQSLGYRGEKQLVAYSIALDAHAAGGSDNSFYVSNVTAGHGNLYFGDGGVDDAEDPDLIVHEYAHAILDWISPLTFTGTFSSQPRALAEGFCDYWAFSDQYAKSIASGRDAACFAEWDTRCADDASSERCAYGPGVDCLRRLDSAKTMRDYITGDSAGVEHQNSAIWSSAMRDLFLSNVARHGLAEGKRITDTIAVEAMFGIPPAPTFADIARRMIFVDRVLFGGTHGTAICDAMVARGIVTECGASVPRGERTMHPGLQQNVPIPDINSNGIVSTLRIADPRKIENVWVRVDINHTARGDLRIVLIAPDGTEVLLQAVGLERAEGPHVTYGVDAQPAQPLSALRGKSAAGEWQLRVIDFRPRDTGTLESWSLILQLEGDAPAQTRPTRVNRQVIPVVGHVVGLNETRFATDVRLFGSGDATLIYTPSHADGATSFAAMHVVIPPQHALAFDDVVRTLFNTNGTGQLEIASDAPLLVSSRTYADTPHGTLGESIPAEAVATSNDALWLPIVKNDADFRTNLGVAELAGSAGVVRIQLFNGDTGASVSSVDLPIRAHSHFQIPASGPARMLARVQVVDGNARVTTYASIVDNHSGDAIHVTPRGGTLAPAIHTPAWHTDLWSATNNVFTFDDVVRPLSSGPGNAEVIDVVRTLFGRENAIGAMRAEVGERSLLRIYTNAPGGGTYGQAVPFGVPRTGDVDLLHVESRSEFRTNVGAVLSAPGTVRFQLFDATGNLLAETTRTGVVIQFPLTDLTGERVHNGRIRISSETPFVPYASLVDNRTGDPSYVSR